MATKETKIEAYQILAANRHAHCPLHIPVRQFNAVRTVMEKRFMKEYMNTPSGLYTSEQVWGSDIQKLSAKIIIKITRQAGVCTTRLASLTIKTTVEIMNTYIYKGQKVFLAYTDNVPGVNPIRISGLVGCYPIEEYNGCRTCFTIDEMYLCKCDSEDEIVDAECMNFENEQSFAEGWYTKHYAEIDKFERELCVKTTDYHCWTSELTRLIRAIWDKQEEHVIPKWWADSERESWKETVDSYRKQISDDNPMDTPDVMTFDEILEQEGIGIESE